MTSSFTPVSLEQSAGYYEYWERTPVRSLDYTLPNIWGWQEYYGLEWRFEAGLCWIRQSCPLPVLWAPLGDWNAFDWRGMTWDDWRAIFSNGRIDAGSELVFLRVPEELTLIWSELFAGRLDVAEDRGQWEYLYKRDELALLPGNRFHKKKNHCNSFVKAYGENYHSLDDSMVEDVLALQDNWCQWHECGDSPSLRAENEAINRVLSHWNRFRGLCGGSLHSEGQMVAFSVGERLDGHCLGVHYEKGLNGFRGVYQAMNRFFAQKAGAGFTLINRAQDMDEDGLRQAKLSYLPTDFLRKYRVRLRKA
ncbi:MAG: phosphatidylglycerol lysyltransferase domain-containing protein [Desulfovibrio sp.]|jgi:hypothetical protein|nr:phosphatidylglycerol lysyltransferase domain-containing protein [Desulfovibrio sp.]